MIRTETGACGERVYAASACGERRGLRGTLVSGRASGRATAERYLDEGGFWLDLADLARAAKDRRGGEMRGENYRSTGGVREAMLTPGARGGRRSTGPVWTTPWLLVVAQRRWTRNLTSKTPRIVKSLIQKSHRLRQNQAATKSAALSQDRPVGTTEFGRP